MTHQIRHTETHKCDSLGHEDKHNLCFELYPKRHKVVIGTPIYYCSRAVEMDNKETLLIEEIHNLGFCNIETPIRRFVTRD